MDFARSRCRYGFPARPAVPLSLLMFLLAVLRSECMASPPRGSVAHIPVAEISNLNIAIAKSSLPYALNIAIAPGEYPVLVRVNESAVDVALTLLNDSGAPVKTRNHNNYVEGDEGLLISMHECGACRVLITPIANVSPDASLNVRVNRLDAITSQEQLLAQALLFDPDGPFGCRTCEDWEAYANAAQLWRATEDYGQASVATLSAAYSLMEHGKFLAAQQHLASLIHDAGQHSDHRVRAWAAVHCGFVHYRLGNLDNALACLDQAAELARGHWLINAYREFYQGLIQLTRENFNASKEHMRQALGLFKRNNSLEGVVMALDGLGLLAQFQGDYQRALPYHLASNLLLPAAGLEKRDSMSNYYLANVHLRLSNYDLAAVHANLALLHAEQAGSLFWQASAYYRRARIYRSFGLLAAAREDLLNAVQYFTAFGSIADISDSRYELAMVYIALGDYSNALSHLNEVVALEKQVGRRGDIAFAKHAMASAHVKEHEYAQALAAAEQALATIAGPNAYLRSVIVSQLGEIHTRTASYKAAEHYLAQAVSLQEDMEDSLNYLTTQARLADLQNQTGQRQAAIDNYKALISGIEAERSRIEDTELRRGFLSLQARVYHAYITLLNELDLEPTAKNQQTLALAEALHARTLLDEFNEIRNHQRKRMGKVNNLRQYGHELRALANLYKQQAFDKSGRNEHLFSALENHIESLLALPPSTRLEHAAATAPPFSPTDAHTYQSLLTEDELALVFLVGEKHSWLWLLARDRLDVKKLPPGDELEFEVNEAIKLIGPRSQRQSLHTSRKRQKEALAKIAARIFGGHFSTLARYRHILVIPDGPLANLPLSTLVYPQSQNWFVESHNIYYAPSLSVLAKLRTQPQKPRQQQGTKALVVTDPDYANTVDPRLKVSGLPRLWYSQREAETLDALLPDSTIINQRRATKKHILGHPLAQYSVLHFAAHGYSHPSDAKLSSLYLSTGETDTEGEAYISAAEIADLTLRADLVTLSACDTALGKYIAGDGILGLSRAFFHAGSARVLASLWPVNDRATAELMRRFYQAMFGETRLGPAAALTRAKLDMATSPDWQDPYHWAGFILQGEGNDWRE